MYKTFIDITLLYNWKKDFGIAKDIYDGEKLEIPEDTPKFHAIKFLTDEGEVHGSDKK